MIQYDVTSMASMCTKLREHPIEGRIESIEGVQVGRPVTRNGAIALANYHSPELPQKGTICTVVCVPRLRGHALGACSVAQPPPAACGAVVGRRAVGRNSELARALPHVPPQQSSARGPPHAASMRYCRLHRVRIHHTRRSPPECSRARCAVAAPAPTAGARAPRRRQTD
eukprot:SAG11_NODE_4173_length_2027_cov_4.881224_1_plen_170_part_00